MGIDKRSGSGTRYDRSKRPETPEAVDASPKKPEGMMDFLRRKLEDLKLGNDKLREQIDEAEQQEQSPRVPTHPSAVTSENAHRLGSEEFAEQVTAEAISQAILDGDDVYEKAIEKLKEWEGAIERAMQLPALKQSEFPSVHEYRRAVVEQALARDYEPNKEGRIPEFAIENFIGQFLQYGIPVEKRNALQKKIEEQIAYARRVCAPHLAERTASPHTRQEFMTRGEQEIIIDILAQSQLPMAEEYPASTAHDLSCYRVLQMKRFHVMRVQANKKDGRSLDYPKAN